MLKSSEICGLVVVLEKAQKLSSHAGFFLYLVEIICDDGDDDDDDCLTQIEFCLIWFFFV